MTFILWRIIFLGFFTSGCITSGYNKSNEEYQHVMTEFILNPTDNMKVLKGLWAGETELNGEKYYELQFKGLLKGKNRYLNVFIPLKQSNSIIFKDSEHLLNGTQDAFLVFQIYSGNNLDFFYSMIYLKSGDLSDPLIILKKHFNYAIKSPVYPLALVHLNFSNLLNYNAHGLVWNVSDNGSKPAVLDSVIGYGDYNNSTLQIQWKERNKINYTVRQFGYIGTVLADIVTSPIQLVYYILTGFAVGVR